MNWILAAILAYLLLAVVFLIDKHILAGPVRSPKSYVFYVGFLRILVLILIPFISFEVPSFSQIILSFLSGGFFVFGLFLFFKALRLFETSRVAPAIGGATPIFIFLLISIISFGKEIPAALDLLAFFILICGSFLITYEKSKRISLKSLKTSSLAALFFALSFVAAKYVYISQPFLQGFIWINIGAFLSTMTFLLSKEVRTGLFEIKSKMPKKAISILLINQIMGAGANIIQNWAIALAPLAYVSIVTALQGTQYVFLLILAVMLSLKFPQILKEEVSKRVLFQKIIAILLINGGLILLAI